MQAGHARHRLRDRAWKQLRLDAQRGLHLRQARQRHPALARHAGLVHGRPGQSADRQQTTSSCGCRPASTTGFRCPGATPSGSVPFAGAVFGDAPFFYKFFVSDLTDLQPVAHPRAQPRSPPGAQPIWRPFGLQTLRLQLRHGGRADAPGGAGRAHRRRVRVAAGARPPQVREERRRLRAGSGCTRWPIRTICSSLYRATTGLARLPIDLTIDLGVRLDTQVGVFQIGLAKLMWLPFQ